MSKSELFSCTDNCPPTTAVIAAYLQAVSQSDQHSYIRQDYSWLSCWSKSHLCYPTKDMAYWALVRPQLHLASIYGLHGSRTCKLLLRKHNAVLQDSSICNEQLHIQLQCLEYGS